MIPDEKIEEIVKEVFNLKPATIIEQLNLLRPIYKRTAAYGHFGRIDDLESFTWEKTDKVEQIRDLAGLK